LENQTETKQQPDYKGKIMAYPLKRKNNTTPQHKGAQPQIHQKKEKKNYNTKAQELFNDASRKVNDANKV
jgi:hypothetical protein